MLKLFTSPGACSTACHLALEEAGVPFELKIVDFDGNNDAVQEMLKTNEKGYVPYLEIAPGQFLAEGVAIQQYIASLAPEKNLFPTSGMDKFKAIEWMNYISTEMHKTMGAFFATNTIFSEEKGKADFTKFYKEALDKRCEFVNKSLEGKNFILGDHYSIADGYLFIVLSWAQYVNYDLSPYKNITSYQNRIFERPATQRAFKSEDLL